MQRTLTKISITLSPDLVDDLAYLVRRTGVSRSALISGLLGDALPPMRELLEQVPIDPTPADVVRFRGSSAAIVRERLDSVRSLADDLLSGDGGKADA